MKHTLCWYTDERAKNIEILDYARGFIQYISR